MLVGTEKEAMLEREEARQEAAERDGHGCPYCGGTIPYGTDQGESGECPACVGALRDD